MHFTIHNIIYVCYGVVNLYGVIMRYFKVIIFLFAFCELISQESNPVLQKTVSDMNNKVIYKAVPGNIIDLKPARQAPVNRFFIPGDVIASESGESLLMPGDFTAFKYNSASGRLEYIPVDFTIAGECYAAIDRAPNWLKNELILKFRLLNKYGRDDDFAELILNCEEKYTDEVAFVIAHSSIQALTNSRFAKDIEVIVRNAEFIYNIDDSLKYVDLVEYGDFESGDYYTTTKYMVRTGVDGPQEWVEAPKEIYYWYVVHPKIRQEGIYVTDDTGNEQQRTYDYSWRDYIWYNPNPGYDYRHVNKSTSKGSIDSIARFADRIMKAEILWDRMKTYYPFNREYGADDNALNIIGNWCSRAIPVDAELPRAIQPNQALYEHNGNCGEDAYLVAAACRTALIPIIHRNTSCEDHAFGAIWCEDWHHYEFFRGGLSGNDSYGITNMMEGGSYGWITSIVEGYRPDGYCANHTEEYTDLCDIYLTIYSADSIPVDGAQVIFYANPNSYGQAGYFRSGQAWTDSRGQIHYRVGAQSDNSGKKYALQIYHPDLGSFPSSTEVYLFITSGARAGQEYGGAIYLPDVKMPELNVEKAEAPETCNYGIKLKMNITDIISGSIHDANNFPWDEFHYWNEEESGSVATFICNKENYEKYIAGDAFSAYAFNFANTNAETILPVPEEGEWYAIISNENAYVNSAYLDVTAELIEGPVTSVKEISAPDSQIKVSPNPVTDFCTLELPEGCNEFEVYDVFGRLAGRESSSDIWIPSAGLPPGMYIIRAYSGDKVYTARIILDRK